MRTLPMFIFWAHFVAKTAVRILTREVTLD